MLLRTTAQLRPVFMQTHRLDLARMMSSSSSAVADQLVLVDKQGPVTVLTLNRPKALNALSSPLFVQLNNELDKAAEDDSVKCIVLTGGEKVFAGESWRSEPVTSELMIDGSWYSRCGHQGDERQELCRGLSIQLFGVLGQGDFV